MKKLYMGVLALVTMFTMVACQKEVKPSNVNIVALKGPTAMGMVKFMDDVDLGNVDSNKYAFEISSNVDEVVTKIAKKEVDIAAVPANLASVLYNNTDQSVEVLAINTLGVLYIVETGNTIQSIEDLKGKTIYASGKGATPEYALQYLLKESGIQEDVTIEWKSEHSECVTALAQDENAIAMLPEPFVSVAQTKNANIRVALDLTKEWDAISEESESTLVTGVVIARKEFIKEHPEAVEDFLAHYETSIEYVNENTDQAAKLIGSYDIIAEPIAKKALPSCNIVYIDEDDMKEKLSGYLQALFDQNPKAIGGAMPKDDFYYEADE
ncbi:MAG: ABC transporter substrate-binding protein [Breznakia sp.]